MEIEVKLNEAGAAGLKALAGCAAKEQSRFHLATVRLAKRAGDVDAWGMATDGKVLAVRRLPADRVRTGVDANGNGQYDDQSAVELKPTLYEAAPVAKFNKADRVTVNGTVQASGIGKRQGMVTTAKETEGRFPPVASVIPKSIPADAVAVTIDADLLAQLADAIKNEENRAVTLLISPTVNGANRAPIPVLGFAGFGVIMPLSGGDVGEYPARFEEHVKQSLAAFAD